MAWGTRDVAVAPVQGRVDRADTWKSKQRKDCLGTHAVKVVPRAMELAE